VNDDDDDDDDDDAFVSFAGILKQGVRFFLWILPFVWEIQH
jgi:hypothetical protein